MAEGKGYIRTSDDQGSINISQDVVSVIVAAAVVDVDGVYGLYQSPGKEIRTVSSKKGLSKGIRVQIDSGNIIVDVYIIAEQNNPIAQVGEKVQAAVKVAIEEALGKKVTTVNVHISGISLKKAKQ